MENLVTSHRLIYSNEYAASPFKRFAMRQLIRESRTRRWRRLH